MMSVLMSSLFLKFNSSSHWLTGRSPHKTFFQSCRQKTAGAEDFLMSEAQGRAGCFISTKDWHELCSGKCLLENGKGEVPLGCAHFSYYRNWDCNQQVQNSEPTIMVIPQFSCLTTNSVIYFLSVAVQPPYLSRTLSYVNVHCFT